MLTHPSVNVRSTRGVHDLPGGPIADRGTLLLFAACVVAEVLFILAFDPFPTVDTASHLGSARGFADVVSGGSAATSRLLEWSFFPAPNLLPQLVLSGLVPAVGARWAERLILVGYVLLLSSAAAWAIRQTRPGAMPLIFFILPLTFNCSFLWGFLNFSYSIAGFLLVAGLLLRWEGQLDTRRMVTLACVLLLVFLTHFVGYLESGLLAVCILGAGYAFGEKRLGIVVRAMIALAPSAILTLVFVNLSPVGGATASFNPAGKVKGLISLIGGIVAYDWREQLPVIATAIALWSLVIVGAVRSQWSWIRRPVPVGLAAYVILSSVVALLTPGDYEGWSFGAMRFMLFPVLGAVLWLAYQPLPRRALFVGATVAACSALALAALRYDELRAIETALQDLRALESCVSPGSTVVQANARKVRFGSSRRPPSALSEEGGRLASTRGAPDLGNIDWAVPYGGFLRFREEISPRTHLVRPGIERGLSAISTAPPPLDLEGFELRTGVSVDYVILFGRLAVPGGAVEIDPWPPRPAEVRAAEWAWFESALNQRYNLVKVSPLGIWELWGRRVSPPGKSLSSCTQ